MISGYQFVTCAAHDSVLHALNYFCKALAGNWQFL